MVAVIGGGYAGRIAAVRLRRAGVDVTLVDPRARAFERTRLHEMAARGIRAEVDLGAFVDRIGARHVQARAVRFPPGGVLLDDGRTIEASHVLLAVGAVPDLRGTPGAAEHAVTLSCPEDASRVAGAIAGGHRIAVVGAGLTGIELACELAEVGASVTLFGPSRGLSARGEQVVRDRLEALGARWDARRVERVFTCPRGAAPNATVGRSLAGPSPSELPHGVQVDGGSEPAGLVVWTAGQRGPAWLADAGLPVDGRGRVRVAPTLEVRPGLFAAGDCAATGLAMACATAIPSACHAAANLLAQREGRAMEPFRYGWIARLISLGRGAALIQGTDPAGAPTWTYAGPGAPAMKELVLKAATAVMDWEASSGVPLYGWRRSTEIGA